MTWEGEKYLAQVEAQTLNRLEAVGAYMTNVIRQDISIPSRIIGQRTLSKGPRKGLLVRAVGARGSNRSKPGEPPHWDYGNLSRSMGWDVNQSTFSVRIGSSIDSSLFLELGTVKMQPRPYLRPALAKSLGEIKSLLVNGIAPLTSRAAA